MHSMDKTVSEVSHVSEMEGYLAISTSVMQAKETNVIV